MSGTPNEGKLAGLQPRTAAQAQVPFGRDLTVQTRGSEYDVTENANTLSEARYLEVETSEFLNAAGDRQLNPEGVVAYAQVVGGGHRVKLHVCFDRTQRKFGSPGAYVGTVSIVDPRVARVDVPFTVTMTYHVWQWVVAIYVAMLLPALAYVWLIMASFTADAVVRMNNFDTWIQSRNAIIALGTGFAVSFGLMLATYFKGDQWGTGITEATALFGACFSAFVAAATGVTAAGKDKVAART